MRVKFHGKKIKLTFSAIALSSSEDEGLIQLNFSFGISLQWKFVNLFDTKCLCFTFAPTQHSSFLRHCTFHLHDFETLPAILISFQLEQTKRKADTGRCCSMANEILEILEVSAFVHLQWC